MTATVDVVVVGAGAIGSAAAWWIAQWGYDVMLLEQFAPGHDRGSSHGGSRIFRFAYPEARYVDMARRAVELWRELEEDTGESLLEITGGIDHGTAHDVEPVARALAASGCRFERLTPGEATARWAGMRFDGPVVFSPDAGRIAADTTIAALQRRVAELGGLVQFNQPVRTVDPVRNLIITGAGEVHARESIVIAAGAWVAELVGPLGFPLPPLHVTREQVFHFAPAEQGAVWPSFIHHAGPPHYGLFTPGEGIKVAEHGTGPIVDPDSRSFDIDPVGRQRVVDYVAEWLPGLDPSPVTETTCLYTNAPESSFIIERHGDLVVGSACSGHGFKFTPATGRRLAELAVARD